MVCVAQTCFHFFLTGQSNTRLFFNKIFVVVVVVICFCFLCYLCFCILKFSNRGEVDNYISSVS